ncbi:MAG: alpha/beta hydrolase [Phenylobacterium sp.]|jgi:pimeloyl-ACP methyl ester carboxylesterase|uniref:alpha/beta fold hydrolase n=2 Tax=Phenylobacterium sp. TaxID=1871053 RepID=UPI0025CF5EB2|nr:alpha/beta hydrolase [Phenylobacterium sp.]MCA3712292.1 alpha/beta hydrolase [Phenylobacterium sp.]MCA3729266.1 alpha/beta hydrolase [Phenylobacterium sp.]MCA3750211.1 alpha/beta hydrolase [Phenylobacterium sp.]MCA3758074.1 alpha/beta hydrolase [Phenylobacterium sp.]MCA6237993.1 alpha/beta hydrolase [Phenylobacterium sp.]
MDAAISHPALVQTLEVCGLPLVVRRSGTGPVVVCLHATGHGARDFDRLAQRRGGAFTFIALDWPGQGDSPREAEPASAGRYAALVGGLLEALDLRDVILLGNSIGGAAAILCAANHADRVRGLVLCNSGGLIPPNLFIRMFCRHMARRFEKAASGDAGFPVWFRRYYQQVLPRPEAAWRREEIVAGCEKAAPVLAEAWRSFAEPDADIRPVLRGLRIPILFAWGLRDRILPWFLVRGLARRTPGARIALFDAGHAAFLETPEAFDAAFMDFARSLPEREARAPA